MPVVGGDITEIQFNHPTIGTGFLFPKASEDSMFDLGGFRTNDDSDNVDGSGRTIRKLNRTRWSFTVLVAWDMNVAKDLEKVMQMAGDPVEAVWTISHVNGSVYQGTGSPVGDYDGNGNAATFPLNVSGGGRLRKIA